MTIRAHALVGRARPKHSRNPVTGGVVWLDLNSGIIRLPIPGRPDNWSSGVLPESLRLGVNFGVGQGEMDACSCFTFPHSFAHASSAGIQAISIRPAGRKEMKNLAALLIR